MNYLRSLLAWTAGAVGTLAAIPAFAVGTAAGTPVNNAVSLDYSVNGFAQSQETASVQFVVDRAIATVVQAQGANAVVVTANQSSTGASGYPALNFDVTNSGNDTQDLWLAVSDRGATTVTGLSGQGAAAAFAGSNVIVAIDSNGNGTYEAGTDTVLSLSGSHYVLPNVAADATTRILVVVDVPQTAVNDAPDTFTLIAGVAVAGGGAFIGGDTSNHDAPGFSVATNDPDVVGTVQNLFADSAASNPEDVTWDFNTDVVVAAQDGAYNGQHSDSSAFVVRRAQLYVGKTVQVLWDPVNGNRYSADNSDTVAGNPKAIPGAVLMYAVGVQNDAGSVAATGVTINDNLQNSGIALGASGPVYVPNTVQVTLNGSPVSLDVPDSPNLAQISYRTCAAPGSVLTTAFGADPAEVSASLGDCAANETGVIVYFVTVQ